jgi:hypothetical protein
VAADSSAGFERRREPVQPIDQRRRQALRRECVDRLVGQSLHVDVLEHGPGDPVGQRGLHVRVVDQRGQRLDEPVGVGHRPVGPHREDGDRRQHAADHQQDHRQKGPPAEPAAPWRGGRPQGVDLAPQAVQLGPLVERECGARLRGRPRTDLVSLHL